MYNLKAAAGSFGEGQKVEESISVNLPSRFKASQDYFACTVIGASMNKVIPDGSICLFRKYAGGSREGKIVLVELDDLQDQDAGSRFTVKEYHSKKKIDADGWEHESITLKPVTTSNGYKEIHLTESNVANLKVIGVFECVLDEIS